MGHALGQHRAPHIPPGLDLTDASPVPDIALLPESKHKKPKCQLSLFLVFEFAASRGTWRSSVFADSDLSSGGAAGIIICDVSIDDRTAGA